MFEAEAANMWANRKKLPFMAIDLGQTITLKRINQPRIAVSCCALVSGVWSISSDQLMLKESRFSEIRVERAHDYGMKGHSKLS